VGEKGIFITSREGGRGELKEKMREEGKLRDNGAKKIGGTFCGLPLFLLSLPAAL